eukprot:TRINITY_DN6577_c0_g1_i2.p1 TRINITY_DN6577_c0_g1~~TRINITY_DN6577_c0_g1_i2.p1  ORF type:complete len:961 (+),score=254.85 TRINITY_DN6577_c0_g1_i2:83-2884(+)
MINVHVVAHTHDDVGWLKTVDEYYYGANSSIQDAGVQYILDTVVDALMKDEHKKFIYVEIAFFMRWWREQDEFKKEAVRGLVREGRLEFINGGWCMNDEANTHFTAIIEQMTRGHQFIFDEFGVRPRIGWHIDPFGHAATQASLYAQMGFDAFFFGRIDWQEHNWRGATNQMEFIWRGSQSLGKQTEIFAHLLYSDYCYLQGTSWEGGDQPIQDDNRLYGVNIKQMADQYAKQIRERAAYGYITNNILAPFGCDFAFQNAHRNFKNMDKLMRFINENQDTYGLNMFYSTPSIYLDSVHAAGATWTVKTGDFFPYADDAHSYWSGYFTSRAALKAYIRETNNFLHSADKIFSLSLGLPNISTMENWEKMDKLTQAFSVAQHHDAVAGTEQQHVADDYAERLSAGIASAAEVFTDAIGATVSSTSPPSFTFCPLLNVSICAPMEQLSSGQTIAFLVYSPVGWTRHHTVRFPVPTANVNVVDANNTNVPFQLLYNDDVAGWLTLAVEITIPPLGFSTYFITPSSQAAPVSAVSQGNFSIESSTLQVEFDASSGKMASVYHKIYNKKIEISQNFLWWNSSAGYGQPGGAYIMRPNNTTPYPIGDQVQYSQAAGNIVQEAYQQWNDWISQTVRLWQGDNGDFLEIEATIGPVDISDGFGKEVFTRFSTNFATNGTLYTDSEGMEFITRKRNQRDWPYNVTEPIASNYYPMNQAAYINDASQDLQFNVITVQSRGVASINDGELETCVYRRLLVDDWRGVGEPLNETYVLRTKLFLIFTNFEESADWLRPGGLLFNAQPIPMFSVTSSPQAYLQSNADSFAPLVSELPRNIHLLDLKTLRDGRVILRFTNIYATTDKSPNAGPGTVDLSNLFRDVQIVNVVEMTMTANRPLDQLKRLVWKTVDDEKEFLSTFSQSSIEGTKVTINPMDTRTFIVRLQPN